MADENSENIKKIIEASMASTDAMGKLAKRMEALGSRIGTSIEAQKQSIAASTKRKSYAEKLDEETKAIAEDLRGLRESFKRGGEDNKISGAKYREELTAQQKRFKDLGITNKELEAEFKLAAKGTSDFGKIVGLTGDGTGNFAKAMKFGATTIGSVTSTLVGAMNGSPLAASNRIAADAAKLTGTSLSGLGGMVQSSSLALAKIPRVGGALAVSANVMGGALQLGGAAAQTFAKAVEIIGPIMETYLRTYKDAATAGATFGGGMTELRETAGQANMKMADLVGGVSAGSDAFQRGGLNFAQATKVVGQFGKGLTEGKEGTQLLALGFTDIADRVALAGSAYDRARASGISAEDAQKNLTGLTVQYAKDLKTLQGIAGKNAEAEMMKGRAESQRAAITSTLDAKQREAFEASYAAMAALGPELGDKSRVAMAQILTTGTTNIKEIASNPALLEALMATVDNIRAGNEGAAKSTQNLLAEAGQKARDNAASFAGIDTAAIMNAGGDLVKSISSVQNQLMLYKADPKQAEEAGKAVQKVTENTDATTSAFAKITESANKVQVALEQVATDKGPIALFAKTMESANTATLGLIETIKSAVKTIVPIGAAAPGVVGGAVSNAAGSAANFVSDNAGILAAAGTLALGPKIVSTVGSMASGAAAKSAGLAGTVASAGESLAASGSGILGGAKAGIKSMFSGLTGTVGMAGAKKALGAIPLIGDIAQGAFSGYESGSVLKGLMAGGGSLVGRVGMGAAGAATTGFGSVVTQALGSYAGASAGEALYDKFFGGDKKTPETTPVESSVPGTPSNVTSAPIVDPVLQAEMLNKEKMDAKNKAEQEAAKEEKQVTGSLSEETYEEMTGQQIHLFNKLVDQIEEMNRKLNEVVTHTKNTANAVQ